MSSVKKDETTKKKNKWYYVLEYKDANGNRKQKKKRGFRTKDEANAALTEAQYQLNNGTYIEPTKLKYKDFVSEWLKTKKGIIAPQTMETYQTFLKNHIVPALGAYTLTDIRTIHIQAFINELGEKGLSSDTVRKAHAIIRNTLEYACDLEVIPKNPAKKAKLPKQKSNTEIKVWNEEEAKRFLEVAIEDTRFMVFHLAILTGMRQGEILGLSWKDVDLKNGMIKITQTLKHDGKAILKGAKSKSSMRTIHLHSSTITALEQHKKSQQKQKKEFVGSQFNKEDLVICSEVGTPLNPANLKRTFNRLIKTADVPKIRFHDLRHTHATFLLSKGVNIKLISERLGHSNVRITLDIYSHVLPSMQEEAIKKLDSLSL